jgi:hypothetical protein
MPTPKVVGDILRPPLSLVELGMRISEIASIKPKTPAEARVDSIRRLADQASETAKVERELKRLRKAREQLAKLQSG